MKTMKKGIGILSIMLVCIMALSLAACGVFLAFAIGEVFNFFMSDMKMIFSAASVFIAFGISSAIGIIFGYMPAKNASKLNPIDALQRE